jgi:hypothetical protein
MSSSRSAGRKEAEVNPRRKRFSRAFATLCLALAILIEHSSSMQSTAYAPFAFCGYHAPYV